jgi:hypothetical protein
MLPTALVAVVGTVVILLNDFNPNADSQGRQKRHGDHGAITAAAVSRPGAIEIRQNSPLAGVSVN